MSRIKKHQEQTAGREFVKSHLLFSNYLLAALLIGIFIFHIIYANNVTSKPPVAIYITPDGKAIPSNFNMIDATGSKRGEAEVYDYVSHYINDLYSFTQYTVRGNLEKVFKITVKDAQNQVKNALIKSKRYEHNQNGRNGGCKIHNTQILETAVDTVLVQVVFEKLIWGNGDEFIAPTMHTAILRLKVVTRQIENAHGFYVVEYRENPFKENIR